MATSITNTYASLKAAIDAGYPLAVTLVNMANTTPTHVDGHEVMITGYNDDGTIEYFDPESGTYKSAATSDIYIPVEITGIR